MRKRILFIIPSFEKGGTTTSLLNLLKAIDGNDSYVIAIFAINCNGQCKEEFSSYAELLWNNTSKGISDSARIKQPLIGFVTVIKKSICKVGIDMSPILFKTLAAKLSNLNFDYIIAFQEGQVTLLGSYISAPRRIAWVHCEAYRIVGSDDQLLKIYNRYSHVVCVSNIARNGFVNRFPSLNDNTTTIYNSIDVERVQRMATDCQKSLSQGFNIISVGRIDPVKRFSKIPGIARKLKNKGIEFKWYIIGGAAVEEEERLLKSRIIESGVEEEVSLLGLQQNPYPFIAEADLLVCLSYSETFNYTIAEAQALNTPVLSTDFPCAIELIDNGVNGRICPLDDLEFALERIICKGKKGKQIISINENCRPNSVRIAFDDLILKPKKYNHKY